MLQSFDAVNLVIARNTRRVTEACKRGAESDCSIDGWDIAFYSEHVACLEIHLHKFCRLLLEQEERRRGYFDEAGNYVEKEGKDDDDVDDAWLKSEEGEQ